MLNSSACSEQCVFSPQRQCLGLLSRFGGSDRLRQFKFQDGNVEGDRVSKKDEVELAMQQVRGVKIVCLEFYGFGNFDKNNSCVILQTDL